ncbi:hypothetical protein Tcan_00274 [Toxocara canis]|uniref:Uncharacterized protein n=1 Tax=Toxocara canis TaxID=6265 RepID=A0A0B2VR97_TOXCA|nr:hypothetical protein Tcan_00274 [Toxocara canis]
MVSVPCLTHVLKHFYRTLSNFSTTVITVSSYAYARNQIDHQHAVIILSQSRKKVSAEMSSKCRQHVSMYRRSDFRCTCYVTLLRINLFKPAVQRTGSEQEVVG